MASRRKQEEKHLSLLREMVAKEHNKTCFDCHQRGPTYVNMTIGSFVCTSCSGILRGLNPPMRVKSISMASYTPQEIEFLQKHGNEICRTVYLGLYDSKSQAGPESREENKVRDFMIQKYEKKRWYVEPSQAAAIAKAKADSDKTDKGSIHSSASSGTPEPKPLRTLVGNNVPNLVVGRSASTGSRGLVQNTPPATPPSNNKKQPAVDLLADFGTDPFAAAPAPAGAAVAAPVAQPTQSQGGFADFSQAFGSQPANQSAAPAQQGNSTTVTASSGTPTLLAVAASSASTVSSSSQNDLADLFGSGPPFEPNNSTAIPLSASQNNNACDPFQPFGAPASSTQQNDFGAFTSATMTPSSINQTTSNLQNLSLGGGGINATPAAAGTGGGDKYAAFSELSTLDSGTGSGGGGGGGGIDWNGGGLSASTSVDWGNQNKGTSGLTSTGEINWGGGPVNKPVSSAGSTMFGSTSMPNMAGASSMGGGGGGLMGATITTQAPVQGFGTTQGAVPPASNPFMGTAMTSQPNVASNPFLANAGGLPATSTAMPQANGMFPGQFPAQPATSVSYGAQPVTSTAFPTQMPGKQMNGGVMTGFGAQMPNQFAATQQGQFAAQGHAQFPAAQQQQHQFPAQQGQIPQQMGGQFPGQFPTQGGAVGMPATSQMGGFGMPQQQPQQQLSFGGAGMSAMAGMQFQKQVGQQPAHAGQFGQQSAGQFGQQSAGQFGQPAGGAGQFGGGGFGVGAQTGQQQQAAAFNASWGAQQPAMNSNPFMASGFGTQPAAQLPPKTGSSNPFL